MTIMTGTKKLIFAGLCAALGVALPLAFHAIPNAGGVLLPMHIPVLLCGFICGPWLGLICGALTPLVSSIATGMPPTAILPGMVCELAVYGLISGLLFCRLDGMRKMPRIYIALLGAMLLGRVTYGVLNALLFRAGAYSMQVWVAAAFITSAPGVILQLIIIPAMLLVLARARLIELE